MKKLYLLLLAFVLASCVSVKKYNEHLKTQIDPENLKKDTDFAYKNLQKLHPNLYWYIDKKKLDYKFDSLKSSISAPLNPSQYFEKLAPIISEVREGHLILIPPSRKYSKKEIKDLKNQKGLFSRMDYLVENNRIFVKENDEDFEKIEIGTEILEINNKKVTEYLKKYEPYITSDGFNTTYHKYAISRRWPTYFTIDNGILDSVKIVTSFENEVKEFYIHREKKSDDDKKEEKKEIKDLRKDPSKKTKDYDLESKSFNRDLQFIGEDSAIAYMKIKTFSGVLSKKFYRESFKKLKEKNAKHLIIDIRDNLGGSLSEINNLYSYLVDEEFKFINDIEITATKSMFEANYLSEFSNITKPIGVLSYPFYSLGTLLSIKKKDGKTYLRNNGIFSVKKPKENNFPGKIYVLINGSSFSASSTIASKLKNDQRATLVGEETGGGNDGTVAGRYSTKKLPNSKLLLPIGLMLIQPNIEFSGTKKGVTPHVEILPTLEQILTKEDPALNYIIEEIELNSENN